jgi:hypothetical protein
MICTMPVELFRDEDAGNWHFRVPALHINGGGMPTRQEAERESIAGDIVRAAGRS